MNGAKWTGCLAGVLGAVVLAIGGCHRSGGGGKASGGGLRIVTLSPALSQMVMKLGDGKDLVGVTDQDAVAPAGLPAVGMYFDVNSERLLKLRPTVVLMMTGSAGVPARLKELSSEAGFRVVRYPYPNRLADIGWILAHHGTPSWKHVPKVPSVGEVLGKQPEAKRVAERMFARLDALGKLTSKWDQPRVLLVIGTDPLMASGPGTVNDQLLKIAGARNVAAGATVRAPTFGRESLLKLDPQVVIFLTPGAPPLRKGDARLAEFDGLDIAAAREHRVAVIHDKLVLLPGVSVVQTAFKMAKIIHPTHAVAIDRLEQEKVGE